MNDAQTQLKRLETLESQVAFQEQSIEDLNKTITEQWAEFDKLRREIARLKAQLSDVHSAMDNTGSGEPPPPHY